MRSDYRPAETFCCVCGCLIRDHQIGGSVEGTAIDMTEGKIEFIPFDAWFCREHFVEMKANIKGGLPKAHRRARDIENNDRDQMGE